MGNVPPQHHGMVLDANLSKGNAVDQYSTPSAYTNIDQAMVYNGFDINLEKDPLIPHANSNVKGMVGECDYSISQYTSGSTIVPETFYAELGADASAFNYFTFQADGKNNRGDKCLQTSLQTDDSVPAVGGSGTAARSVPLLSRTFNDRYCYAGVCSLLNPEFEKISIPFQSPYVYQGNDGPLSSAFVANDPTKINSLQNIGSGLLAASVFCNNNSQCTVGSTNIQYLLDHYYGCSQSPSSPCAAVTTSVSNYIYYTGDDSITRFSSTCGCSRYYGMTWYEYPFYYTQQASVNANNSYIGTVTNHRTELGKGGFALNTASINNNVGRVNNSCSISGFNQSTCTIQNPYDTQKSFNSNSSSPPSLPKYSNYLNSGIQAKLLDTSIGIVARAYGQYGVYGGISCLKKIFNIFNEFRDGYTVDYCIVFQLTRWAFIDMWRNKNFSAYGNTSKTISGTFAYLVNIFMYYPEVTAASINSVSSDLSAIATTISNYLITAFSTTIFASSYVSGNLPIFPTPYDTTVIPIPFEGIINQINSLFNFRLGIGPSLNQLMYSCYYATGNVEKLTALAYSYLPGHDHKRSWMYAMYPEHRKKSRLYFDGYNANINNRWASGSIKVADPYEDFEQYASEGQDVRYAYISWSLGTKPFMNPKSPYNPPSSLPNALSTNLFTKDFVNRSDGYNIYSGLSTYSGNIPKSTSTSWNEAVINRSILIPYKINQSTTPSAVSTSAPSTLNDYIQPTSFPRVYSVMKFMGPNINGVQQPLITFFWAHIPIYPGCGYPSSNMDMIDLYGQNDYAGNAYHDRIFLFYLVGDEYAVRTNSNNTVISGWKWDLIRRGINPICEEDYYIESVYHGQALLARSNDDASQRLNLGNYNLYSENDISATVDTSSNPSALGGNFGNFRFYVKDTGVFIYKDKTLNGDFTPHTDLIPTPGMISCVGIKCWTPFRESDGSQSVFKSLVMQQGINTQTLSSSSSAAPPATSANPNPTPAAVTTDLNGAIDINYNNIQYHWEHINTMRIQKHPIHPEQVVRPVTMNSNMFKAEGWTILNIGGSASSGFITPSKQVPFTITNNQISDTYFTSGVCQLNKWGLPASNNIVKGEWFQFQFGSQPIYSYSFSARNGYASDTTLTGPSANSNGPALDRTISDWLVVASNDGYKWDLLDRRMNVSFSNGNMTGSYTINYPSNYSFAPAANQIQIPSYTYFRIVVSAVSANNLDLIWDVGNFSIFKAPSSTISIISSSTSIIDKAVNNLSQNKTPDNHLWDPAKLVAGNFSQNVIESTTTNTLNSNLYSIIQSVPNDNAGPPSVPIPNLMNNTINSYYTNPIDSAMTQQPSPVNTASIGTQNKQLSAMYSYSNFASIHLDHYLYAWNETYSRSAVGTNDPIGNLYTATGLFMPYYSMTNGVPIASNTGSSKFPTSYPIRYGQASLSSMTNLTIGETYNGTTILPTKQTYERMFDSKNTVETDWKNYGTVLLHSHWVDVPTSVPMAIRVHSHKWDKPASMFPNRSSYKYYSGTTSTSFNNPYQISTPPLQTEKTGDTNVSDPRFRWSSPFYTGSYLLSPYINVPIVRDANGNQIQSNATSYGATSSSDIIPKYCFWIQDQTTYNNLIAAQVPVSSDNNFNMNIGLVGSSDKNTYNNVPTRCLGALYYNSTTDTNLNLSGISSLCPSPLQYKALGWRLCYVPSTTSSNGPCALTYPSFVYSQAYPNPPNAIINKYNTIIYKIMDAYTAQLYYDADPNKDIASPANVAAATNIYKAAGGCSSCNCMAATSLRKETVENGNGYCVNKATMSYYQQMKEINGQQNIKVFSMTDHPQKMIVLEHEMKREFYNNEAYQQKKKKEPFREHFDICHTAASLISGGANFILGITYNPLATLLSKLKPFRAMHPVTVSTPDWSCNIDLDEILDSFCSLFKAKQSKPPPPSLGTLLTAAYNDFCNLSAEFVTGPCYVGGVLFDSLSFAFGLTLNNIKSGLAALAFGASSGLGSLNGSILSGLQIGGSAVANVIVNIGSSAWNALSSAGSSVISSISTFATNVFNAVSGIVSGIGNAIADLANTVAAAFLNTINTIGEAVSIAINTVGEAFTAAWNSISDWFSNWF
jgi:hypothetical protein